MYKLPKEIKKVLLISSIVLLIVSIILLIIKPVYVLFILMGYLASVFNIVKNNFLFATAVFSSMKGGKALLSLSYFIGVVIYLGILTVGFYNGLFEGFIVALGIVINKIIIIILYGFK